MIRRLDHIIVCGRDCDVWARRFERVLALTRSRGEHLERAVGLDQGSSAVNMQFGNWEFDVGDGCLGVVSPSSPDAQLERFLAKQGEAFYAVSVDIGSMDVGLAHFTAANIPFLPTADRDGNPVILWPVPRKATAGVLFEVFRGAPPRRGSNPNLLGLRRVVLVVDDLGRAVDQLGHTFSLSEPRTDQDGELLAKTATFELTGSSLPRQDLTLAFPLEDGPLATHLGEHGPSIFEWGLAADDLDAEVARLETLGITTRPNEAADERSALIDPAEMGGLRFRLHEALPQQ